MALAINFHRWIPEPTDARTGTHFALIKKCHYRAFHTFADKRIFLVQDILKEDVGDCRPAQPLKV